MNKSTSPATDRQHLSVGDEDLQVLPFKKVAEVSQQLDQMREGGLPARKAFNLADEMQRPAETA